MMPRLLPLVLVLAAACTTEPFATPAAPAAAPTATAAATPMPVPSPAGSLAFSVAPGTKATVRVREQLANVNFPSDAVLSTTSVKGAFSYLSDESFDPSSRITVDLSTLASDESRRDRFIKDNTLQTNRFPEASFVPARATGLPSELPRDGRWTFQLQGNLTIRNVTKPVTWEVQATRSGGVISATAKTNFKFTDFGMQVPRVFLVLSIEDDIHLEITLVAKPAAA